MTVIQCLRAVAAAARKHAHADQELAAALADLDKAIAEQEQRYQEALKARGIDCVVCGRRFLPYLDQFDACCSVGCRLSDTRR